MKITVPQKKQPATQDHKTNASGVLTSLKLAVIDM